MTHFRKLVYQFRTNTIESLISEQLLAPYKQLIDGLKQNRPRENNWTTDNLTNNQRYTCKCTNGIS